MRLIPPLLLCALMATPVLAKPPLREVKEIDDQLMLILVANEIQEKCDEIGGRMIKGFAHLERLKSKAAGMGYSRDEIDDYVTSKAEKKRMRNKAEAWLASQGVKAADKAQLCAFGHQQIAEGSYVGSLLR
ncbi:DUF5333 domain-containing protein [Sagittula salina]|uniref:DUF5333 domain-containing protein n=1 Tax=Sagittula salina TaxID=2820268 RepID=A0A940RZG2_9RHOB|nr:DUF5333 domain-containing protein [Sagittula salina]MBP0481953.1 DUF5333 domain-containing protein [Sagittula salina]